MVYDPENSKPGNENLADQEKSAGSRSGRRSINTRDASSEELDRLIDTDWDTNIDDEKKSSRWKITGKKVVIGGGITGLLLGGGLGFLGLSSGPLQFMHISQMLQKFHFGNNESFMESRNRNLYTYMKNYASGENHKNNLGRNANKVADAYEARLKKQGIELSYENPSGKGTGRIQSIKIDPETTSGKKVLAEARSAGIDIPEAVEGKIDIRIPRGKGNTKQSRALLRATVDSSDMGKISSAMSKRLLIKRGGVDFHPLKNTAREKGQSIVDYYKKVREERAKQNSKGATEDIKKPTVDTPEEGAAANPEAAQIASDAEEVIEGLTDVDALSTEAPSKIAAIKNSMLVKGAGSAAAVVGLTCTVRAIGEQAEEVQYTKVLLPMMRIGMQFVSVGSQISYAMATNNPNAVNFEELGALGADLFDKDAPANAQSFFSAQSIQAENGKPQTGPDLSNALKPASIEGEPAWLATLNAIPALSQVCGISDTIQGLPVIKQFGDLTGKALSVVSGDLLGKLVELVINVLAGDTEILHATGAELGNVANYGSLLGANDSAISMGGKALGTAEVATRDTQTKQERAEVQQNQDMYTRYLDLYNPDSLAAKALLEGATTEPTSQKLASVMQSPAKLLQNVGSVFSGFITPRIEAQEEPYSYGIPEYGFTQAEMDSEDYEDPFANAAAVEPHLDELNEKYGKCFGTTITNSGKIETKETVKYSATKECNNSTDPMLVRYRFYIADTVAMATMSCYEINEGCDEIGFGSGKSTSTSAAGATIEGDVKESSENIACAAGTKDVGVHDGYTDGNLVRIRLCAIPNIKSTREESTPGNSFYVEGSDGNALVNSRVSGAILAMATAAAADGVPLSAGSSFRTNAHQASLAAGNSNRNLVGAAGYSNHQLGIAVDYAGTNVKNASATTCASRVTDEGSPVWRWLKNNASRFGFKQLSTESWHWDAGGGASRCE